MRPLGFLLHLAFAGLVIFAAIHWFAATVADLAECSVTPGCTR